MASRPAMPRKSTVMRITDTRVINAVTGAYWKLFFAAGARLRPISATIEPVTTGGITMSIHFEPASCTTRPTMARRMPATITPPSAPAIPWLDLAAMIGALGGVMVAGILLAIVGLVVNMVGP